MSALQFIHCNNDNELVKSIREIVKEPSKKYNVIWVKAHFEEIYNELVDELSKGATKKNEIDTYIFTYLDSSKGP